MNRIQKTFQAGSAYVGYLTAGDGGIERSLEAMRALIQGGVNMLEIGIPFSDPVADGPTIQQAAQRALQAKTTLDDVLQLTQQLRQESDIPIILFTYYNPILVKRAHFYAAAKKAGADGVLVVDLPIEEADTHCAACKQHHLSPIFLISPSTPRDRIEQLNEYADSMLYYVCRNGTTGMKDALPEDFPKKIQDIKSISKVPIITGFGISTKHMAKQVLEHADGFVIGSLFVKAVGDGKTASELTALAKSINPE